MASPRRLVIADTSALVAALDERDRQHDRCARLLETLRGVDLVTTCAAFTEAIYLLGSRYGWPGRQSIWNLVERGVLRVAPEPPDWTRVAQLMGKYRDTPMALADAQLMTLAEEIPGAPIFTLDSDFTIYRLQNGSAPELLP